MHHTKEQLKQFQVTLNPEALLKEMSGMQQQIEIHRDLFQNNPYTEVGYESFSKYQENEAKRLLPVLGIDSYQPLTSDLVKINTRPISELVDNHDEVKDSLAGTTFHRFI